MKTNSNTCWYWVWPIHVNLYKGMATHVFWINIQLLFSQNFVSYLLLTLISQKLIQILFSIGFANPCQFVKGYSNICTTLEASIIPTNTSTRRDPSPNGAGMGGINGDGVRDEEYFLLPMRLWGQMGRALPHIYVPIPTLSICEPICWVD